MFQQMFTSEGVLKIFENNWLFIQCDPELVRYYISRFNRSHVALDRQIMLTRWEGHISIVRGENIPEERREFFINLNNKPISFQYDPEIKDNGNHFWLDVKCDEGLNIREQLGLKRDPHIHLHLTIGVIVQSQLPTSKL